MMEIKNNIVEDLKWLAEKTEDPIVKITYSMAVSIVELHFDKTLNRQCPPVASQP